MLNTTPFGINSQRNHVIKEDRTFWVVGEDGDATSPEHGFYLGDTRIVADYRWEYSRCVTVLQTHSPRPDRVDVRYAVIEGPDQLIAIDRRVRVAQGSLSDELCIHNYARTAQRLHLTVRGRADFRDLFIVRGFPASRRGRTHVESTRVTYHSDTFAGSLRVELEGHQACNDFSSDGAFTLAVALELQPQTMRKVTVKLSAETGRSDRSNHAPTAALPDYHDWEASFPVAALTSVQADHRKALTTAVRDLRGLLLSTVDGVFPAAGIPWYVAVFGRDALITAYFLRRWRPDVVVGVLRHLARLQGRVYDSYTEEAPGKIPHELRDGELAATGCVPHRPYYGTVDATALYVVVCATVADPGVIQVLQPAWEAALRWIVTDGDRDGDGFVEYRSATDTKGATVVQSWKDSHDSMSHANGTLASGDVAGAEVQGYSYAAYRAAATMYAALGNHDAAQHWETRATQLQCAFDDAFWLEEIGTYAMALDGTKHPLRVRSSNAGQLLWSGIVPQRRAETLVRTLFSSDLWTGWGIRTLGSNEQRYNPVSYHNGSVWPHDTTIIALGLMRYGYHQRARTLREALFDLASEETDSRLPELVAGYRRSNTPAVPYPVACRPQAWDAAALIALALETTP